MIPAQRENLRLALLVALERSKPYAVSLDALAINVLPHGFPGVNKDELRAEVEYLIEKNLAKPEAKKLSPEIGLYTITADGRDFLAEKGLA